MHVLNPGLYEALKHVFRHVEVTSQGDPGHVDYRPDWNRGGKIQARVSGGEYYRVNCPFCTDTRKRLYINYRWGTKDPRTGWKFLHLVNCFNEGCVDSLAKQKELQGMLDACRLPVPDTAPNQVMMRNERPPKIELPQGLVPITDREAATDACLDLEDRGFDVDELWDQHRLFYCEYSASPPPKLRWRIVIPVYGFRRKLSSGRFRIALEGWQARAIEPVRKKEPKYLTLEGMRKSENLYGATAAFNTEGPVIVCEGPTDVWRLKTNGVAIFGKDMSTHQCRTIVHRFENRPVVVFLDRPAQSEARKIMRSIRAERRILGDDAPVVRAKLPRGRSDVGECTWEQAWRQVAKALDKRLKDLRVDPGKLPSVRHPKETAWKRRRSKV